MREIRQVMLFSCRGFSTFLTRTIYCIGTGFRLSERGIHTESNLQRTADCKIGLVQRKKRNHRVAFDWSPRWNYYIITHESGCRIKSPFFCVIIWSFLHDVLTSQRACTKGKLTLNYLCSPQVVSMQVWGCEVSPMVVQASADNENQMGDRKSVV